MLVKNTNRICIRTCRTFRTVENRAQIGTLGWSRSHHTPRSVGRQASKPQPMQQSQSAAPPFHTYPGFHSQQNFCHSSRFSSPKRAFSSNFTTRTPATAHTPITVHTPTIAHTLVATRSVNYRKLFSSTKSSLRNIRLFPTGDLGSQRRASTEKPAPKERKRLSLETLQRLPKSELHLHLDGAIRPETILELAKDQKVTLPADNLADLRKLVTIHGKVSSLVDYLKCFDITLSVLQTPYGIKRAIFECCEDQYLSGVRYCEIRFSPLLHQKEGMALSQIMEAACEGIALANYHFRISAKLIICGMRQLPPEQTEILAEIAWRYQSKHVVAFDLAGPEVGFSSKIHKSAFDIVRNNLLNCTLHSGEAYGWQSIADSIHYCGLHRIGHGITLETNKDLMAYVIDQRIPVETCVTSNVQTSSVPSLDVHPIRRYFDAGVVVVACTDNPRISDTNLPKELEIIQDNFDFTVPEMVKLIDNGIKASFLDRTAKTAMRSEFLKDTLGILKEEGHDISFFDSDLWRYRGVSYPYNNPHVAFWTGASQFEISKNVIKELPKADLHCRLTGSVSVDLLWDELHRAGLTSEFSNKIELQQSKKFTRELFANCLQQTAQLERALQDIVDSALSENVKYMELFVRPSAHSLQGLSDEQVVTTLLQKIKDIESRHAISLGLILYANCKLDDPIEFRRLAELCVKYRSDGVIGFGAIGKPEIGPDQIPFFRSTFDYLKKRNINVVMKSGTTESQNLVASLRDAGAKRISGGFELHTSPRIMNYLADHRIPLEIGFTELFNGHSFTGNPLRLYLDNHVPIALCSFHETLGNTSRTDQYYKVANEIHLNGPEFLAMLHFPFKFNFSSYEKKFKLGNDAYSEAKAVMKKYGLLHYFPKIWSPSAEELLVDDQFSQ